MDGEPSKKPAAPTRVAGGFVSQCRQSGAVRLRGLKNGARWT